MFKSKYSTLLTVLLVILIVAIIVIVLVLGIKTYKDYQNEKDAKMAFQDGGYEEPEKENKVKNENKTDDDPYGDISTGNFSETNNTTGNNTDDNKQTSSKLPKVKFYKGFTQVGNIEIPKTKASYPIVLETSAEALEVAVGVTYPSSPNLNKPGNIVIIGHNYRNGKLFSNNKNLVNGDTIKIKDIDGNNRLVILARVEE